ncbi:MAG TPA: PilN domain-containing protein, partial [Chroococcales cyanobacterium]
NTMGQAAQVARTVFGDITDELSRSLEFYKSQVGDVKVDQILLTGPGCMVPDLAEFIASRMGIKTVLADAMRDLVFSPDVIVDSLRPILAALIGSSIEPPWNPSFTVDLDLNKEGRLPLLFDERKTAVITDEFRPARWFKPVIACGIFSVLIALGAYAFIQFVDIPAKAAQIKAVNDEMLLARKQVTNLTTLKSSNNVLIGKKKILDKIVKKSSNWAAVLDMIGTSTPANARLDAVIFGDNQVKVEGEATDFAAVSDLVIKLSNSGLIADPSIEWAAHSEKEPDLVSFKVTARVGDQGSVARDDEKPAGTVNGDKVGMLPR